MNQIVILKLKQLNVQFMQQLVMKLVVDVIKLLQQKNHNNVFLVNLDMF